MNRRYQLVDVFHDRPMSGNPLAVVFDADGLATEEMQQIARWLNLSETTFVLPPTSADADYRVRIFTVTHELPFAGHPTLGTCHAWLAAGGTPHTPTTIVQECGAGLVPIRRAGPHLAFAAPALIRSGPVAEADIAEIARFLQIDRAAIVDAQWGDNGPGWVIVLLESAEAVLALNPPKSHHTHIDIGVVGMYLPHSPAAVELRAFFSDHTGGIIEDPVTGSLNASVAQWLLASGRLTAPYTAAQGTRLGRSGRVFVSQDATGAVWVAGQTTTLVTGTCSF